MASFLSDLSCESWNDIFDDALDINAKYDDFFITFKFYFEKHFPVITSRMNGSHKYPRYSQTIREMAQNVRDFHNICKIINTGEFWSEHRNMKNSLKQEIKNAHRSYNAERIRMSGNRSKTVCTNFHFEGSRF